MKRSGPLKRTPMKRTRMKPGPRKHKDDRRISEQDVRHIQRRDQGCIAALWLKVPSLCKDAGGRTVGPRDPRAWELDHVNDFDLGVSHGTPDRVVLLCAWHHRGGWATSVRPLLRLYLKFVADMAPRAAGAMALTEYEGIFKKGIDNLRKVL